MIEVDRITKIYGSGPTPVRALDEVSFSIEPAEIVGLVGPSGSGKTSLLNILGCLDRPTSGTVRFDRQDLFAKNDADLTRFRAITLGFVFQSFNLFDLLTAVENVEYPLQLGGVTRAERRERALGALAWVGLQDKANRRADRLSGGEKQRVAVARALVHRPKLVLADEPTANLDSETGARVVSLMFELNQRIGSTFVIATHDPQLLAKLARVVTILDGRLVNHG
jgi:putative ABC transport system ATP-binding protein